MRKIATSGFTLVEMLITISILGILAVTAIPMLSSNDPQKLNVAAAETANILRLALTEAKRTGGYVLVDGKSVSGRLRLYYSTNDAKMPPSVGTSAILDPMTKLAIDLNVNANAFSQGVTLTPLFRAGGQANKQLLIGPGLTQMQGFDGVGNDQGTLEANSGVQLSYGGQSVMVNIHHTTGLVTLP